MPATLLGAPGTRSHHPEAMERGIREFMLQGLEVYDAGYLERIFNVRSSEKKTENHVILAELGQAFPKAEGDSPTYDAMQEYYKKSVTHTTFCLAAEITEEAIEDNLYIDLIPRYGMALGKAMGYTRQVQAFSFFNDLTETIYSVGGTNYQILETAVPCLNGQTWANKPTNATGLSQSALEERLQAWGIDMITHRGLKMNMPPRVLMVGYGNQTLAHRILNSPGRSQEQSNDTNPVKDLWNLDLFVNPHMTNDGRWFILGRKEDVALVQFDRVKANVKKIGDNNDTGNMRSRARMRISHFCPHQYAIMGSEGS